MKKKSNIKVGIAIPNSIIDRLLPEYGEASINYNKAITIIEAMVSKHMRTYSPMLQYLPYASDLKRKIIGGNAYYRLWNDLIKMEILQTKTLSNGHEYSYAGGVCKHLRINPALLSGDVKLVSYILPQHALDSDNGELICQQVKTCLDRVEVHANNVEINIEAIKYATSYVQKKFVIKGSRIKYQNKGKAYGENTQGFSPQAYLQYEKLLVAECFKLSLNKIVSKRFYVNRCDTNNRINHNLTNSPKAIFNLLLLEGEDLVEIDLSCSQPLLLAHLLKSLLFKYNNTISIFNDTHLREISEGIFPPLLFSSENDYSDIDVFISVTMAGKLYEYFSYKLYGRCDDVTRDEAKQEFISAIYSGIAHSGSDNAFTKVFPELASLLLQWKKEMIERFKQYFDGGSYPELKRYTYSKNKGKKDARSAGCDYLPVRMTEFESEVFIDEILTRLYGKNLIVLSKHDSILCKSSEKGEVLKVVKAQLNRLLGKGGYHLKSDLLKRREDPRPLPKNLTKNGYALKQIHRSKTVAIYVQKIENGKTVGYEVFKIKTLKAGFDKYLNIEVPFRETYPRTSDWGSSAWTSTSKEDAFSRFLELEIFQRKLDVNEGEDCLQKWIIKDLLKNMSHDFGSKNQEQVPDHQKVIDKPESLGHVA